MINAMLLLVGVLAAPAPVVSTTVIENVRVELGDGRVFEKQSVVLAGDRISAIGSALAVPQGAVRIDGSGKVLTPGLIESHTQLGLIEVSMVEGGRDAWLEGDAFRPAFRAADGFNPSSARMPIARAEGLTTIITSPSGGVLSGLALAAELDGTTPSDRSVALFGLVGEAAAQAAGKSRGGVWRMLRRIFNDARFLKQNRAAIDRGDSRELALPPSELEALFPVLDQQIPWVVEAHRASDIRAVVNFAKQEKLRVVIAGATEAWRVADILKDTPVILRPSAQMPRHFESLTARDDAPAILHRAGVPVILSAGDWENNVRRLRQEAGLAVAHGMPREAALRAISYEPARAFGLSGVGTIAPGQRANVVLWSGDPLELNTQVEALWIGGRRQPLVTRQDQLARRYWTAARPE